MKQKENEVCGAFADPTLNQLLKGKETPWM